MPPVTSYVRFFGMNVGEFDNVFIKPSKSVPGKSEKEQCIEEESGIEVVTRAIVRREFTPPALP